MGIKERREREKQLTRQAILQAARQIAQEEGWVALTIRKIGEAIEYSPSMVYEYFNSKEAVLTALLHEGFDILEKAMRQAFLTEGSAEEKLYRIGEAYCQVAQEHPDLYQVMHGIGGVSIDPRETAKAVEKVCGIPLQALEEWAASEGLELADPLGKVELMWCSLHGVVSLTIINRVSLERVHSMIQESLEAFLLLWRKT